ncbi:MAG TPA: transporter substrate-binding domain-containing protein, partial [Burkholderiales bacterium]|nr:transporter substrate-binding domain-containing protein [Burkholderiales bacterium]
MALAAALIQPACAAERPAASKQRGLVLDSRPWKGDFDGMLARRTIRVLVPYSRSLYYVDKGRQRGIEAELVHDFERYLNRKYAKRLGGRPLTVYLVPTPRDKLLSAIAEGRGDIAAGNLTVTEQRLKLVDFVVPKDRKPLRELIVTGPASPRVETLDDLSGKVIHVRKSTSYY